MTTAKDQVLIIGGGHNSLVCAAYLAGAGRNVVVLERRPTLGGLAGLREFHPGYRLPGLLQDASRVRPRVVSELSLAKHGLELRPPPDLFIPERGGPGLVLAADPERARAALEARGLDAAGYAGFRGFIDRVRPFFGALVDMELPEITGGGPLPLMGLLRTGWLLRRLGAADMADVLRVPPMPVQDWLSEYLSDPLLVAALAAPGLHATLNGPREPSTAGNLLLFETMSQNEVAGGPAAFVDALVSVCRERGVSFRCNTAVERILVGRGRVRGVRLADGTELEAGLVVSGADPRTTLLDLVEPANLPQAAWEQLRTYRMRGTSAVLSLALRDRLTFAHRPGDRFEHVRIAEHPDTIERAADSLKYRELPQHPHLSVRVHSVGRRGLCPAGHEVVSIIAHYVPVAPASGWTADARATLEARILDVFEAVAPGLRSLIVGRELLTPADIAEHYALTGGHLDHGEHALDQLMSLRPVATCAGHRAPIPGLFLCSGGTHPGGGVTGGPGRLAARAVLAS